MTYISCRFYSKYLAHQTEICVLLPDTCNMEPEKDCPVIYLLHGKGDDCTGYTRLSPVERYAEAHQVAVIMPSAESSFYVDGVYGKRYFSYMTKELPDVVHRCFSLTRDPKKTYIAGLSMGGYGALKIGLSEPERFAGIGVFSAGVRPDQFPDFEPTEMGNEILHEDVRRAFGDGPLSPENIPQELLRARVAEGRSIPPIFHYEGSRDFLYEMNQDFRTVAERLPVPYHYFEWDGDHDWVFWDEALRRLFDELFGAS